MRGAGLIAVVWMILALPKPAQPYGIAFVGLVFAIAVWKVWRENREPVPVEPPGPGLYPDPQTGLQRYWDGQAWSDLPPRPMGPPPGVSSPAFTLPPLPPEGKARGEFFSR